MPGAARTLPRRGKQRRLRPPSLRPQASGPKPPAPKPPAPKPPAPSLRPPSLRPPSLRPQASGPQASGPQASGPQASGPQASGPKPPGPQASGPQASGPQASGPQAPRPPRPPVGSAGFQCLWPHGDARPPHEQGAGALRFVSDGATVGADGGRLTSRSLPPAKACVGRRCLAPQGQGTLPVCGIDAVCPCGAKALQSWRA